MATSQMGFRYRIAPALTLILAAPMVAEVLPGATRVSSIFVLPIEMGVWGCGALMIRAAVRHWRLGWLNMLLLALALSLAEECVIQQTSLAPMYLQLVKGPQYARDFGVNWLYLLWALGYESVLVVFLPVMLTELIFRERRDRAWLNPAGWAIAAFCFVLACIPAWYSWTQFVRPKIFHLPVYVPPRATMEIALGAILVLILAAIGPFRRRLANAARTMPSPAPVVLALTAAVIATGWTALLLLSFRIRPDFPPAIAGACGLGVAAAGTFAFARWSAGWTDWHRFAVAAGGLTGTMGVFFLGFTTATPLDLYGKIVLDSVAVLLLIRLGLRLRRRPTS